MVLRCGFVLCNSTLSFVEKGILNGDATCSPTSGAGTGVYSQAARLHFHQEGAELAGRPDARVEEEETGGRATRGATRAWKQKL